MNISCARAELRDAVRLVSAVVDPRNIKPILKDIRIRTTDDGLELSATDLEVALKYFVRDVEVKEPGGIIVPADPLVGITSETLEERLSLRTEGDKLLIEGKDSKFHVVGLPEEEFPEIPDFPGESSMEIEGSVLKEMISKTIFAVALEKQRYALNWVLLTSSERSKKIEMVGTDGLRLAVVSRKANSAVASAMSIIIPSKALKQLQGMIGDEESVKIKAEERQILVKTENGVLVAQLVEGRFPPYSEVIPQDCNKRLEINAATLANLIRQAAVLAERESRSVWLKLDKESLIMESSDPESGDAHVAFAPKYEGDPIEVQLNPDFLLDGLKVMGDENIRIEMTSGGRAVVIHSEPGYVYMVMPITQE